MLYSNLQMRRDMIGYFKNVTFQTRVVTAEAGSGQIFVEAEAL